MEAVHVTGKYRIRISFRHNNHNNKSRNGLLYLNKETGTFQIVPVKPR
jgi:hypothetical protein